MSESNVSPEQYANNNDRFIDAWGHELRYELKSDDSFTIYSLGRDGKPGGVGLDADLFTDRREGQLKWPTFMQFYFPGDPQEIQKGGLVGGAVFTAAVVMSAVLLSSLRAANERSHGSLFSLAAIVRVIGVVLLAIVIGVVLAPLHIPNGH
ncbi:MAG TPA: type II secretion system protein GspG [Schlesneria sp.]